MSHANCKIEVPIYNPRGKETINQYLRRVEKYKNIILKEKYDEVLNFVNDWLNLDKDIVYESLTQFRNIKESILLKNEKHNRNVVEKYVVIFNNKFELNPLKNIDEAQDKYILNFLTKLLGYIDYNLVKREFKGKFIYSIRKI